MAVREIETIETEDKEVEETVETEEVAVMAVIKTGCQRMQTKLMNNLTNNWLTFRKSKALM